VGEITHPVLALDLVFRGPPSFHAWWALADEEIRAVSEDCQTAARDRTLRWLEDAVAGVRWGRGGRYRAGVPGLVVAVFRHFDSVGTGCRCCTTTWWCR
jgi:hypothetical protein